jgi:hypothetical protein
MIESPIALWTTIYLDSEVRMTTKSWMLSPRIQVASTAVASGTPASDDAGRSVQALFDQRDRAFELLLNEPSECKEDLLPFVVASTNHGRPSSEMTLLYETLRLLPDFDDSYFLRVVQSHAVNGNLFRKAFEDAASRDNAEALLLWAASLDTALTKYARICLVSRPGSYGEHAGSAPRYMWTVQTCQLHFELLDCAA